jgi:hypothetical protein
MMAAANKDILGEMISAAEARLIVALANVEVKPPGLERTETEKGRRIRRRFRLVVLRGSLGRCALRS